MKLHSVNPVDGSTIATYATDAESTLDGKVRAAVAAQWEWSRTTPEDRAARLREVGRQLRNRCDELARLMAVEMGKPITQGAAEVEKCAWTCDFFAENAARWLQPEDIVTEARRSLVAFEPLGVVLAVMPWNFPFWQVIRCAIPALAAGNGVVLKHASNVTGCALGLGEIFDAAGFPPGLFGVLIVESARVSAVVAHPGIRAVSLTGSVPAGRAVAAAAGAALKRCVLELGGSDPYVILPDADLDSAARIGARARLVNGGQSCIAAKRFIVVDSVLDPFVERLRTELARAVVGDPLSASTTVGPLARRDLRDELREQVRRSIAAGATRRLGGDPDDGPGAFHPVTLLSGVRPGMPAFDEETFGPVAAVVAAGDEAEAIELANRSSFGLGAAVFTGDPEHGLDLARRRLEAGAVFVNASVQSDPRLPFGGIKDSGYGRELGPFGLREFVNIKTVVVG